jgi:hypothetical protein
LALKYCRQILLKNVSPLNSLEWINPEAMVSLEGARPFAVQPETPTIERPLPVAADNEEY